MYINIHINIKSSKFQYVVTNAHQKIEENNQHMEKT